MMERWAAEHLALVEVDAEGRQVGFVAFDLDDEDADADRLNPRHPDLRV